MDLSTEHTALIMIKRDMRLTWMPLTIFFWRYSVYAPAVSQETNVAILITSHHGNNYGFLLSPCICPNTPIFIPHRE